MDNNNKASSIERRTSVPSIPASPNSNEQRRSEKFAAHARVTSNLATKTHDGKTILTEKDCEAQLGFSFPRPKKWLILSVIFIVQVSMNYNASVYGNAVAPLMSKYNISHELAVAGQAVFLIAYGKCFPRPQLINNH
jgi:hypothetical protein